MKLDKKSILELYDLVKQGKIVLDFSTTCDLCGQEFQAIHKGCSGKADCSNCGNEVYTDII